MKVRKAKDYDVMFLKRLLVQLGYPDMSEDEILAKVKQHEKDGYCLFVSESDQEVVGFIALHWFDSFHFAGNLGRITAFCVDERFRGQGIGIQLLQVAEALFKANNCTKIEVTSNKRRTNAHQFYLNRGYEDRSKRFVKEI